VIRFAGSKEGIVRVAFNRLPTLGQRTGIGHYAEQLLACLRDQAGTDHIHGFPSGWLWQLGRGWYRWRPPAGRGGSGPTGTSPSRSRGFLKRLKTSGRDWLNGHLCGALDGGGFDIYHEPNNLPLPCAVPTLATVHDLSVLLHPEWHPADRVAQYGRHWPRVVRQCRHFLAVSEFTRQELIRILHLAPERVTRVHNGIRPGLGPLPSEETAEVLRRLKLPVDYLLCVSTIEPRKNLGMLLRAFCGLDMSLRSRCPLVVVGTWGWGSADIARYLDEEARHRGVMHLGYVADEELAALYNGARALLFPSLYEGFGLPAVEMLACGGAVLASTARAVAEVVGPHAHLIDPADEAGWRDAMRRVIQDEDWRRSLRQGAAEWGRSFTWARCAEETWRVYRALATGGLPAPAAAAA
jgi:alpha-1,3-rhamnosyl/mannosyltransferase